jgi:hypothetical protein
MRGAAGAHAAPCTPEGPLSSPEGYRREVKRAGTAEYRLKVAVGCP